MRLFERTLREKWNFEIPAVLVSFDSPRARTSLEGQVARASKTFKMFPDANSWLLVKTDSKSQPYVDIENLITLRHKFADFDILGITEKELGPSTLGRMVNIARLRTALTEAGLFTPIHVFGSLDTISTPLYFFAGADIFDGLTWSVCLP